MSDAPTIAQILSDPRAATHVALDYCNEQMARCLDRVDALEAENAALREFVAARDVVRAMETLPDLQLMWSRMQEADQRETDLRQRLATEFGFALPGGEGRDESAKTYPCP